VRKGALWFPILFLALIVLSLLPASWTEMSGLHDTVPRWTPTRVATPTPTGTYPPVPKQTITPPAVATKTTTPYVGQQTPTGIPPTAAVPSTGSPTVPEPSHPSPSSSPVLFPPAATLPPPAEGASPTPWGASTSLPEYGLTIPRPTQITAPLLDQHLLADGLLTSGEPLSLRSSDGRITAEFPVGASTSTIRLYLSALTPAHLPPPPQGYRFGSIIIKITTGMTGTNQPNHTFSQPFVLSLAYDGEGLALDGDTASIGYLAETSSIWALLETKQNATTGMLTAYPRWPGIFAILVHTSVQPTRVPDARERLLTLLAIIALTILLVLYVATALPRHRMGR